MSDFDESMFLLSINIKDIYKYVCKKVKSIIMLTPTPVVSLPYVMALLQKSDDNITLAEYRTTENAISLLKSGMMTHLLDVDSLSFTIEKELDEEKYADEVPYNKRKKLSEGQKTFVKTVLPLYISTGSLMSYLPSVMAAHGMPDPCAAVFGEYDGWT